MEPTGKRSKSPVPDGRTSPSGSNKSSTPAVDTPRMVPERHSVERTKTTPKENKEKKPNRESDDDDDEEDDKYKLIPMEMTDDQTMATEELYNLKLDLGFVAGGKC